MHLFLFGMHVWWIKLTFALHFGLVALTNIVENQLFAVLGGANLESACGCEENALHLWLMYCNAFVTRSM